MEIGSSANGHGSFFDVSKDNDWEEDNMDPVYKLFLEHLRRDGRSYILEMEDGDNGLPVFVKYEQEETLPDSLQLDAQKSSGYRSFTKKRKMKPKKMGTCKKSKAQAREIVDCNKSKAQAREIVEFSSFHDRETPKVLAVENYEELRSSENMPHLQFDRSVDLSVSLENPAESNLPDDNYQEFLSCLKVQNGFMVMEYNSVTVVYEENETFVQATEGTPCSGSQELVLYGSTLSPGSPDIAIYEVEDKSIVPFNSCLLSSFDLKLMSVVSKPFDQNEYESLWKQANYRKPILRHKDLRSQCKSFSTRQMGLSYLDHFPDLARQLKDSDPQQSLVLLRGFFFWLKNLCHKGSYQPWISAGPQIVEVLDQDIMFPHEEQKVEIETLLSPLIL